MSEAVKAKTPARKKTGSTTKAKTATAGKKKPTAASARPKAAAKKSVRPVHAAASKKRTTDRTATKKATANKSAVPRKAAKKPVAAKPAAGKHVAKKPTVKKSTVNKSSTQKSSAKKNAVKKSTRSIKEVSLSPVALEANRRNAPAKQAAPKDDLFMERKPRPKSKKKGGGKKPPTFAATFGAANICLVLGIALFAVLMIRQQSAYAEFQRMRQVVDQQTFYEGTTIEGVDVSNMTLNNAMEYWRDRVEARNENRTVVFDDGTAVTAKELGYLSDYESVLSAAWSAGRNGSLEERYRMASSRVENPVAYRITRRDTSAQALDAYVEQLAEQIDRPAQAATIASFDPETYEFQFNESVVGRELDRDALKTAIVQSIAGGGGNVALPIQTIQPEASTDEVAAQYGLIDYAITNASSSSKARLNNIKVAMSFINGTCVAPGETFSFNDAVGERTGSRGFKLATAYSSGEVTEQVGGGICQVSTTLFNAAVKADMEIVERHNHSLTVHYVDKGKDATVDWGNQDFKFRNTSDDNIYICCYLTDDKRVRFGIFGKLLPNGEKITLEAKTTEVMKAETEYQPSAFLAKGATYVLQEGRNGYKAEAYKVRWDAAGNEISKELLCKSTYRKVNEIIQYGA